MCREEGEWFEIGIGVRWGCVMSPWVFDLFMDAAIQKVREKAGDVGVILQDERRNIEWEIDWLKFADETVLLGDSEEELERLVQEFGRVCQRRKLSVCEAKTKIMKMGKYVEENEVNISLKRKRSGMVENTK